MKVEVVTPEDYMGDVMGDLNRRRGFIQGMEESPAGKIVRAEVPLSEMFGYATDLRSDDPRTCNLYDGVCQSMLKHQQVLLKQLLTKVKVMQYIKSSVRLRRLLEMAKSKI